jgi:hypothetical protein
MDNDFSRVAENIAQLRLRQSVSLSPQESILLTHPSIAGFYHHPIPNNSNYLLIPSFSDQICVLNRRSQAFAVLNRWICDISNFFLGLDESYFPGCHEHYGLFKDNLSALLKQKSYFLIPETIASFVMDISPGHVRLKSIEYIASSYNGVSGFGTSFHDGLSVVSVKFLGSVSIDILDALIAYPTIYRSIEYLEVSLSETDLDKLKLTAVLNRQDVTTTRALTEALTKGSQDLASLILSSTVAIYSGYHDMPLPLKRLSQLIATADYQQLNPAI